MKVVWSILSGLLLILAIGVGFIAYRSVRTGTDPIEQWVGSQLQVIANSYLNPQLSFEDLDYQYPGTVKVKNLKLLADDPSGSKVAIFEAAGAVITLAEIPKTGQPIVIERIRLDSPMFRAIATAPHSGQFIGFSNLVRTQDTPEPPPASASSSAPASVPASQPATAPSRPKLSDYFRMRKIKLVNGSLVYDPRTSHAEPMVLDKINTDLDLDPDAGNAHRLKGRIAREPVFDLLLDGLLDLDNFRASEINLVLEADLSRGNIEFLPPQLQKVLTERDLRGRMSLQVHGDFPLLDPAKGNLSAGLMLADANLLLPNYHMPVENLSAQADLKDARVTLHTFKLNALGGEANVSGTVMLNETLDSTVKADISQMQLQMLQPATANTPFSKLAGALNARMNANVAAGVVRAKWNASSGNATTQFSDAALPANWGAADFQLTHADLRASPLIQKLNSSLRIVPPLMTGVPSDRLDAVGVFTEDRIEIRHVGYVGAAIAARGRGTIWLDHKLDLILNAGSLEKFQNELGFFGKMTGAVTDSMARYRVTGTLEQAGVSLEVGEPAVRAVESAGTKTVEGVGKGLESIGKGIGKIFGK